MKIFSFVVSKAATGFKDKLKAVNGQSHLMLNTRTLLTQYYLPSKLEHEIVPLQNLRAPQYIS